MAHTKMAEVSPKVETARSVKVKGKVKAKAKAEARKAKFTAAWTPERRDTLEAYVRSAQSTMRLQHWVLKLDWTSPCEGDCLATITPMEDSAHATIRLGLGFLELPAEDQTQTILHELMHCHLFDIDSHATGTVEAIASEETARVFAVGHNSAIERAVDALADVLLGLWQSPDLDLS